MRFADEKTKSHVLWIAAICLPMCLILIWHCMDRRFPRSDSASYLNLAQAIYFYGTNAGVNAALLLAYTFRDWKPILHPILALPFIAIFQGDVYLASKIYLCLCFLLFTVLISRIASALLQIRRAIALMLLICSVPWIFSNGLSFNSEISFLTAVAACLLCWLHIENFKNKWPSIFLGVSLALAFCIRPIEALLLFSGPLGVSAARAYYDKIIRRGEILLCLFYLVICGSLLELPIFFYHKEYSQVELGLALCFFAWASTCFFLIARYKRCLSNFVYCHLIAISFTTLWFIPGAWSLWNWAYDCSIGTMARSSGTRPTDSIWKFLSDVERGLGAGTIFILFFLSWPALIQVLKKKLPAITYSFLLCFFIPICAGVWSFSGDFPHHL